MNRLGIAPTDIDCFARQYEKSFCLKLEGVFTHFASSGVFEGPVGEQTCRQEESFHQAVERLRFIGIDPGIIHLANSAAIASRPETWADMVRPGAILYGYHPGYDPIELRAQMEKKLPLRPVMSLRARIINLRNVPAGAGVGYDSSYVPERPSKSPSWPQAMATAFIARSVTPATCSSVEYWPPSSASFPWTSP